MSAQANAKINTSGGLTATELVARAAAGDRDAFATLYNEYQPMVYRYLLLNRKCGRALAEDLTQDTFVRALKGIGSFAGRPGTAGFVGWLITIARNLHTDHVKSGYARKELQFGEFLSLAMNESPERSAEESSLRDLDRVETVDSLALALRALNPSQRECIGLRYIVGMPVPEVAVLLSRSEGAVKTLTFRAMASMRQALGAEEVAA